MRINWFKISWYSAAGFQLSMLGEWIIVICEWSSFPLFVILWLVLVCSKVKLVCILKLHVSSLEQVIINTETAKTKKEKALEYENWKAWIIHKLDNWPLNDKKKKMGCGFMHYYWALFRFNFCSPLIELKFEMRCSVSHF